MAEAKESKEIALSRLRHRVFLLTISVIGIAGVLSLLIYPASAGGWNSVTITIVFFWAMALPAWIAGFLILYGLFRSSLDAQSERQHSWMMWPLIAFGVIMMLALFVILWMLIPSGFS
jgi:hypothetical protein